MKTKIELDLKSFALGAVIAALAIFGTAATSVPSAVNRYQLSVGSEGKAAIIDTVTGQCWTAAIDENVHNVTSNGPSTFIMPKNT